jgi:LPXTG-motif cell wall-anchored protein
MEKTFLIMAVAGDKSGTPSFYILIAVLLIVIAGYFLLRKKKK